MWSDILTWISYERNLGVTEEIDAVENAIRDMVRQGKTLREARVQHGYHSLQTRKKES